MAVDFDLQQRLGAGQFGEVWLANDTGLNAIRALKLIHPTKVLNPQNLFHEAQILKAAAHHNVVRVEETGTMADGRIYVAMELLPKGSLEDEAKGAYVDLTRAKRVMIDVLRGLEHAHSQGILHRDIKPANILIGDNYEGKLSDFGLAVPTGVNLKALGAKDYLYLLHLAPEVYAGQQYSFSSDIYACGVTLYRLINGDSYLPPIAAADVVQKAVNGEFPDRSRYREFIPARLKAITNRAMDIDPAKRYQSARQMRRALEQLVVEKNWNEKTVSNGKQWVCGWNNKCYEVTRTYGRDGKWTVIVKKGRSKKSLRRVNALCADNLPKTGAERVTQRILQDFVLGKL
jgi:serine/threonine protein kinase